ncbi:hypothetical protein BZL30_5552 [Mycobacterium kansasii]|uniref:Uncharacterized protein n=1 Tax=Mycobacterium kansasii TaxID=1768 RepID=A0A1V3WY14_MYCKA|nr:hypothetical protein BZL30_5552 [Mycobacterium kansasii]
MGLPARQRICDRVDLRPRYRLGAQCARCRRLRTADQAAALPTRCPTLFRDENATGMPKFIRFMLRWVIKAPEFLQLDVVRELAPAG